MDLTGKILVTTYPEKQSHTHAEQHAMAMDLLAQGGVFPYHNITHCPYGVAVALAPCPVGIDMEGPRHVSDALIARCCSESEKALLSEAKAIGPDVFAATFCKLWTKKESTVKCTGEGITKKINRLPYEDYYYQHYAFANGGILTVCTKQPCKFTIENDSGNEDITIVK